MPARTKLNSVYSTLPPAERRVADFILSNPNKAAHMVINDIAECANVSVPSVTRLARRLGYVGFMDFRVALAGSISSVMPVEDAPISADDTDSIIIQKLMIGQMRAVESTLRVLDRNMFSDLARLVVDVRRVVWFGVGSALNIVMSTSEELCRMEVDSIVITEESVMKTYAGKLRAGDLCIAVSRSGKTQRTLDCIKIAKSKGASTAFMTNFANSPGKEYSDFFICTSRLDALYRFCGFETSGSMKVLLEVLATLVANKKGYTGRNDFLEVFTAR